VLVVVVVFLHDCGAVVFRSAAPLRRMVQLEKAACPGTYHCLKGLNPCDAYRTGLAITAHKPFCAWSQQCYAHRSISLYGTGGKRPLPARNSRPRIDLGGALSRHVYPEHAEECPPPPAPRRDDGCGVCRAVSGQAAVDAGRLAPQSNRIAPTPGYKVEPRVVRGRYSVLIRDPGGGTAIMASAVA
jgi:hypothetical protein